MAESPSNTSDQVSEPEALSQDKTQNSSEDNVELDDLLDSALEDFDKPAPVMTHPQSASVTQELSDKPPQASSNEETTALPPSQEALFNELFNSGAAAAGEGQAGEAAADFQHALGDLMSELGKEFTQDPQFNEELSKLLQTTIPPGAMPGSGASSAPSAAQTAPSSGGGQPASSSSSNEDDISRTLGETLDRLSQNAQDIQQETSVPDDFMRAFESMNMGGMGGGGGDADLLPMMQSIMQNLLCKEVLYPSLKEVVGKYPQWLTDNKEGLTESDNDRYCKQLDIMQRLCAEYEMETDSDSQDVKQQRTMKVMDLIQQMEVLGQPPKEIVGEMGPGFQFDAQGNPSIPGIPPGMMPGMPGMPNPEQCSIM